MNEPESGTKGSVLLVDDDKFLVDMYSMKFTKAGYAIMACLSADEAAEALRTGFRADAIVFDLVMPEKDGFAFLETLKSAHLGEGAALVALTNQGDDAEKAKAMQLGVDRYVIKATMIPSEVVTVVGEEIEKKHQVPRA